MDRGTRRSARKSWPAGILTLAVAAPLLGGDAPGEVGQWQPPQPWPVVAIHAAVMPTGEVLHYAYPGGGDGSRAYLWNPGTGGFTPVFANQDLFCSGHSFLPSGALYVTGGNDYACEFQGRVSTHVFDPVKYSWIPLQDMTVGRWYPTNVNLGDGRVLILSGLNRECQTTPVVEMYTPGEGLQVIPQAERLLPLFPWMHLLTSGAVAYAGPGGEALTLEPESGTWEFVDWSNFGWRGSGTSVLLPGSTDKVLVVGGYGGGVPTQTCEVIDFSLPNPQWQGAGSLNFARAHANVVILPDATAMLVGGGQLDLYGNPVHNSELYDPQTDHWSLLPPQVYGRMYHSTAVLLPDGRVLSAGQDSGASGQWGEIYHPAYLFRGPRPEISTAPETIFYGQDFPLVSPQADTVQSICLIRLSSVTHSVNFEQRYVGLSFKHTGASELLATAPPGMNHAPRGYYMLFILNDQEVPSVARMVRLEVCPADFSGDGIVDAFDLAAVLGAWGSNPGHPADLNGDGVVDAADLGAFLGQWGPCG